MKTTVGFSLALLCLAERAAGFQVSRPLLGVSRSDGFDDGSVVGRSELQKVSRHDTNDNNLLMTSWNFAAKGTALRATVDDGSEKGWFRDITINPLYLIPYVGFLAFGFYATNAEAAGASQEILEKFLADPLHPGVNELFATVFNLIGLIGIPLACILMPAAKDQKFPATPFLIASAAAGYGAVGPYVMTRKPVTSVSSSDLGWFTSNVLENKIFNWFMVAVASSSLFTTGVLNALVQDFSGTVQGYVDVFSSTAIAGASSVDFAILCITAATLIPEDLARRGVTDTTKARVIAASTLLLPMIGATIYCAMRPPIVEE